MRGTKKNQAFPLKKNNNQTLFH